MPPSPKPPSAVPAPANEVRLTGRLAAAPRRITLPSGDELVSLRVVVDRPARRRTATGSAPTVDTIECSVWAAGLARRVERWEPGDVVSLSGCLRRRFWRTPAGARSRYDVEVAQARRLR
jgi:single-strand DNA-binding protein